MKIDVTEEIAKKIQERVDSTDEFKDIEEYINYILKQVVERLEGKQETKTFSKEDEEKIKERLRGLGYLD